MTGERWKLIEEARQILGLPEKVCRHEIREAYKRVSVRLHPDKRDGEKLDGEPLCEQEQMAKLNAAYRLLMEYADYYRMSLKPNEDGMNDTEWWMYHFGQDPVWGGKKEE